MKPLHILKETHPAASPYIYVLIINLHIMKSQSQSYKSTSVHVLKHLAFLYYSLWG